MPSPPLLLVSAVALVDADDRILLARRPAGKSMAGLWEFPGGKLQEGETPEAALIRELREELAIGTPQPREGQDLAWVRPRDMASYPMPPADKPLVVMLRDVL